MRESCSRRAPGASRRPQLWGREIATLGNEMKVDRGNSGKMTNSIRGTTPEIERRAIEMRRRMTSAELKLWDAIKSQRLSRVRFRAQHPVGVWILDFYCPALKLVIELDGKSHESKVEYDEIRTATLEAHGYRVIRFKNEEVLNDLSGVLARILLIVQELSHERIPGEDI